jgi:serine carboxypeptidase 1
MSKCCDQPWYLLSQGASGVGLGNFLEMGPLDVDLKPRNSTWLHKADLIFVVSETQRGIADVASNLSIISVPLLLHLLLS